MAKQSKGPCPHNTLYQEKTNYTYNKGHII